MTPDQVRLRLEQIRPRPGGAVEHTVRGIVELLIDVLPELVERTQSRQPRRRPQDESPRFAMQPCPECEAGTCERLKRLVGRD